MDDKPDFMGVWKQPDLGEAHFFIEVAKWEDASKGAGRIVGAIEDPLGYATFEGDVSPERIRFTKEYFFPTGYASRAPIVYEGKRVGRLYIGNFRGGRTTPGTFMLEEVGPEHSPTIVHLYRILQTKNRERAGSRVLREELAREGAPAEGPSPSI